jgi:ferredoxin-NADP reductase
MDHIVKIRSIKKITRDVLEVITDKPSGHTYTPGQATDVSINTEGWQNEKRPFTFTSLPTDDHIEFNIKTYPTRGGVTNQLLLLVEGDELILGDVFGEIAYKSEGVFIAGGAGITPFLAIFRYLNSKNEIAGNKLVFANKTRADIIREEEFQKLLGNNFINVLSDEELPSYEHGFITADILKKSISGTSQYFYLCGPPPMMDAVEKQLHDLHIDEKRIVKEAF